MKKVRKKEDSEMISLQEDIKSIDSSGVLPTRNIKYRVVDLFSGCGGISEGLDKILKWRLLVQSILIRKPV